MTKTDPEVNSYDVISRTSETKLFSAIVQHEHVWYRAQETDRLHGETYLSWKFKMAAVALLNFEKNVNISGLDEIHQIWRTDNAYASRPCGDDGRYSTRNGQYRSMFVAS